MRKNKLTSLILATTLVLQPVVSTVVLQPTIAYAEEQGIKDKAKNTNLSYSGCSYEFNKKSDIKDIVISFKVATKIYWIGQDNKLHYRDANIKDNITKFDHDALMNNIDIYDNNIYINFEDNYVGGPGGVYGNSGLIDNVCGSDMFKLKDGRYVYTRAASLNYNELNFTKGDVAKATLVNDKRKGYCSYIYVLNTEGELYCTKLSGGDYIKLGDGVKDINSSTTDYYGSYCVILMNNGTLKYANNADGNNKLELFENSIPAISELKLKNNVLYTDRGLYHIDTKHFKIYNIDGVESDDIVRTNRDGVVVLKKDGSIFVKDSNGNFCIGFQLKGDYSELKEISESDYSSFQSEGLRKVNALYARCKEQEKMLNATTLTSLKSDIGALEDSDAKTELMKNVEQLEIISTLKSDIESAIKSKDDSIINKGVESLNAVDDWCGAEPQRVELTKQLSDKLTDKAEISRLNGDVTRARKCIVNLPASEATLKNGYLNRLNQIQLLNMDTQIIDAVQALANSINETLASKNYTKQSLNTLKEQADTTQAGFDNIIEPSVRSRAMSFMAMPYSNLCKTIDSLPDLSTEESVKDEIMKADKDINKLINIYVTINNLPKDGANKSKYEELIKKAINDLFKDSPSVDDLVNKIKDAISKGDITKEQAKDILDSIEDEALRKEINDKVFSESKPGDVNDELNKAIDAVIKAEQTKNQSDIDDALTKVNSLPDGLDKDKLMDRINNITNPKPTDPDDTNTPQTVSKDLAVKTSTSNSLELILDTNEITFGDYNGAKDSEKTNAVTATVSSSLPFDLNVSQLNEIKSSTGNKMADELLELRKVGTQYTSLGKGNKKVFESNHESGKDIRVPFDIRLKGDSSVKKDNYQTTLRFEAMQK